MVNQPTTAQLLMAQQGGQDINVLLQRQRVEQQQAQIEKQQEQFRIQQEEQLAEQQSQQAEINKWKEIVQVAHKIASESPLATYGATSEEKRLARELLKGKYELAPVEIREYAKARIERGKASPTPSLHLEKGVRVETPMYEYESDTGQTIIGTKEFVESKIAAEQTAHPFSGTITLPLIPVANLAKSSGCSVCIGKMRFAEILSNTDLSWSGIIWPDTCM